MEIELKDIEFGSCNGCKRGKLSEKRISLIFPYDKVYHISVRNMTLGLCPKCFEELKQKINDANEGGESE